MPNVIQSNSPDKRCHTGLDRSVIVGGAVVFLATCVLFSPFVADDAYIVGRYAQNAAGGLGLVYNVGERVSALTSPLHALLETILALGGLDPVGSYRVFAPLLVLAGWFAALRETELRGAALALFTAASLLSPFLALWTVGGLETPILACLATLFASRLVVMTRAGAAAWNDFLWLGLLAGLMFLTRYDSVLVTAPILMAILIVEYRRSSLWIGAVLCLLVASSWLLFSTFYYGEIFPTSYYVKFLADARPSIDSVSATLNFALISGLFLIVLRRPNANLSERPSLSKAIIRGAAFSVALLVAYSLRASGEHMMFGNRLFVPYLMAAVLSVSSAMDDRPFFLPAVFSGWQTVMICVVAFIGVNPAPLTRLPGLDRAYAEYEHITPATYGQFMDMLREDAEAIAAHWMETGRQEQPRIYLRTGGTGYWLPDFYVYETLVSYRHDCRVPVVEMNNASHYLQQLGFSRMGTMVEDFGRARDDIPDDAALLFATTLDWGGPQVTGYLYGPAPIHLDLGDTIGSECVFGLKSPDAAPSDVFGAYPQGHRSESSEG